MTKEKEHILWIVFGAVVIAAMFIMAWSANLIKLPSVSTHTPSIQSNITEPEDIPLTKEETVESLSELLPEDPIDTPEEITEQEDLLRQLQEEVTPSAIDAFGNDVSSQLDSLTNELSSEEAQLELLRELQ